MNPQDDSFLDREVWDIKNTPKDKFPLLLHYHPLVIYRYQVIKQADIVLAMFLLGNEFSLEQKKRNFDYYDPLTTGDSSLSACIQSIVAAEIGYDDAGHQVPPLRRADGPRRRRRQRPRRRPHRQHRRHLDGHRLRPGRHARLRRQALLQPARSSSRSSASPSPSAASGSKSDIDNGSVTYTLRQGEGLTIKHRDEELKLTRRQAGDEARVKACSPRPSCRGNAPLRGRSSALPFRGKRARRICPVRALRRSRNTRRTNCLRSIPRRRPGTRRAVALAS